MGKAQNKGLLLHKHVLEIMLVITTLIFSDATVTWHYLKLSPYISCSCELKNWPKQNKMEQLKMVNVATYPVPGYHLNPGRLRRVFKTLHPASLLMWTLLAFYVRICQFEQSERKPPPVKADNGWVEAVVSIKAAKETPGSRGSEGGEGEVREGGLNNQERRGLRQQSYIWYTAEVDCLLIL